MRFDYDEDARLIVASIGHGAGAFTETWTLATARSILEELSRTISLATADTAGSPEGPACDKYTFPDGTDPEWIEKWATKMKATPSYREPGSSDDTLAFYYRDVLVLSVSPRTAYLTHGKLPRDERMELWATLWGKANQKSSRTKVAR